MGWIKDMVFKMLKIKPAHERKIQIQEPLSFKANVLKNLTWYRGDAAELEQFFKQCAYFDTDKTRFWAAVPYRKIRKIHSGIVSMVIDRYRDIIVADMNEIDFGETSEQKPLLELWQEIAKNNGFADSVGEAVSGALASGDGAFKISLDETSKYPILSFYTADRVDYSYEGKRLKEVLYYTEYEADKKTYQLEETYGKGYVRYRLFDESGKEVPINTISETAALEDITFDGDFIMGEQIVFFPSNKWRGRGKALFDTKTDPLDSLDEVISQWLDAVRKGRVNRYIPEDLVPRNPDTGELIEPNDFDNDYITVGSYIKETGASGQVELSQGNIAYEAYVTSYSSFLDMVLQGIISPATLGIDLKKNDNATAQREKEKITIYTRNKLVDVLYVTIPSIVNKLMMVMDLMYGRAPGEYIATVQFGEYAAPDFDSIVDTVGKAKNYGVMSIEKAVDEMYGDTMTEQEKEEEVKRIKEQQGIIEVEEPSVDKDVTKPDDE